MQLHLVGLWGFLSVLALASLVPSSAHASVAESDFWVPPPQAIGYYSHGRLENASQLPNEAPGILKIFQLRNRAWGTQDLVDILMLVAREVEMAFPNGERLQISDMTGQNGGQLENHASHQNGLDADVVYYRRNHKEYDPMAGGSLTEDFVVRGKLTKNFDIERNWALLVYLIRTGRVQYFFMDPVIKRTFCGLAKQSGMTPETIETLRRIYPYANHKNHVHVRLTCPATSFQCKPQDPPDPGPGCSGKPRRRGPKHRPLPPEDVD